MPRTGMRNRVSYRARCDLCAVAGMAWGVLRISWVTSRPDPSAARHDERRGFR
jgi:hypothetical protein